MQRREMLQFYPVHPSVVGLRVEVGNDAAWREVVGLIEETMGWSYDWQAASFFQSYATHSVDGPDAAGRSSSPVPLELRARPVIAFGVRFRRVGAGAAVDDVQYFNADASGQCIEFWGSFVQGVPLTWQSGNERTYEVGVQDLENESNTVITTDIKTVSSGIVVRGSASRLPRNMCRVDAEMEVSSFTGEGLAKALVTVPLQLDGPRSEWVPVFSLSTRDANARIALKELGFSLQAGADQILVEVRVE